MFKPLIAIPKPFGPHKVTFKSISKGLCAPPPPKVLEYMSEKFDGIVITVDKQCVKTITVTIVCTDSQYEIIKFNFIKDMGEDFIWKD